jgi:ribosomal protein L10
MKRQEKQKIINGFLKFFSLSESTFIVACPKLNASKTSILKKKLYVAGGKITIIKNSLLKIMAKENQEIKSFENYFKNQIAVVFAFKNTPGVAAAIKVSGYGEDIVFHSGIVNKSIIDVKKFEFIASMPSEKVLKSMLCGVLHGPIVKLIFILKQVSEKSSE